MEILKEYCVALEMCNSTTNYARNVFLYAHILFTIAKLFRCSVCFLEGKGSWSSSGCWSDGYSSETQAHGCRSNHLTHFAILLDVTDKKIKHPQAEIALRLITYIGCGISLLSLTFTFLTFAIFR